MLVVFSSFSLLVLATLMSSVNASNNPACYSTTNEYVHQTITVLQPSAVLIQRYQGSQITIYCSSFDEAGPTCAVTLPKLCSRPALDASVAMTCISLTDYGANVNAGLSFGNINGPLMLWLLEWDGSSLSPSCFPRIVDARLLAFVQNQQVNSTAVFVILLIVAILSVLLVVLSILHHVRSRWLKIDAAGATAIAGPKMAFRGPQLAVSEPAKVIQQGITKVYLPVRDSGGLNELTSDRMGALLGDPNTPHGKSIYLQGAEAEFDRGPGSSMRRRHRPSPPAPGDGTFDPVLQQRIVDARRMNRSRGMGGGDDFEHDEDAFDYAYDDEGPVDFDDNSAAGRARVARWQEASERRRLQNRGSAKKKDNRVPQRGALFPTQRNWATGGGDDTEDSFAAYRSGGDARPDDVDDDDIEYEIGPDGQQQRRRRGGPRAPGAQQATRQQVKYIPQWMHGSFGRGGVIPEVGDGEESEPYQRGTNNQGNQSRQPSLRRGPGNEFVSKQYYQKPVSATPAGKENSGYDEETIIISENGQMRQVPRSALKGRRGISHQQGIDSGADSGAEDALRRGVSFRGDYVGSGVPDAEGNVAGSRAFGQDGLPVDSRSTGRRQEFGRAKNDQREDQFARSAAKVHNRTLELDAPQPNSASTAFNAPQNAQHAGGGGAGGTRMQVVGKDASGNAVYANSAASGFGGSGGDGGNAAFQCADCGEHIHPGSTSYCPVTGKRHY